MKAAGMITIISGVYEAEDDRVPSISILWKYWYKIETNQILLYGKLHEGVTAVLIQGLPKEPDTSIRWDRKKKCYHFSFSLDKIFNDQVPVVPSLLHSQRQLSFA